MMEAVRAGPAKADQGIRPVRSRWGHLGRLDASLRRLLAVGDAAAVTVSLIAAISLPHGRLTGVRILWGLAAVPIMLVLFKLYGLYDRDVKRISHSTVDDVPHLFHATVIGALVVWIYAKYSPLGGLSSIEIVLFGAIVVGTITVTRSALRAVAGRAVGRERALLIGTGKLADTFARKLESHPEYRLDIAGCLAHHGMPTAAETNGLPLLGTLEELEEVAAQQGASRVVLAPWEIDDVELEHLLQHCRALSLKVSILPRLSDVLGPAVEIDDVEGVTVLGLNPPWLPRSSRALKRVVDVVLASFLLILTLPLALIVAIAIKVDSRGPVFFAQERVGRRGRKFRLFKFRSMATNAEQRRAELLEQSTDPHWLKLDHDPRITRVGRWLRRLSIDELPQLWNVVRGEMSMVGPRPLIPIEEQRVEGWARGRLDLTPGITGYWQVLGRTRIPFEEMIKLDYLYVMNWSLWQDVRLMLKTLPVVLRGAE